MCSTAAGSGGGRQPGGSGEEVLSPQEALLAALQEAGLPAEQIQLGRGEGDDETWLDVLDAESDDWMRSPPPPSELTAFLGTEPQQQAPPPPKQQQRQQHEERRQGQP